jgi:hypothetical protein
VTLSLSAPLRSIITSYDVQEVRALVAVVAVAAVVVPVSGAAGADIERHARRLRNGPGLCTIPFDAPGVVALTVMLLRVGG